MKLLMISHVFPPFNVVGAVRVGGFAQYLLRKGHDVSVITARQLPHPKDLSFPEGALQIIRTRWVDINAPLLTLRGWFRTITGDGNDSHGATVRGNHTNAAGLIRAIVNIPDGQIGWLPFGWSAARKQVLRHRPDVIFSSGPPFTGHWIASLIARSTRIPWIAEFRDLFADNPYTNYPNWRCMLDRRIESRILRPATGLITVSGPLAEKLSRDHGKPTCVVMTGYHDQKDRDGRRPDSSKLSSSRLRIVYTGTIYPGRRDPTQLFHALSLLGIKSKNIEIVFCGQDLRGIRELAERYGAQGSLILLSFLPRREALELQMDADVLLMLLWNDPREAGVITGKIWEYLSARRPILMIGWESGVAAKLLKERGLGIVSNDPDAIAAQLDRWLDQKATCGQLPGIPEAALKGLSEEEQNDGALAFIKGCVQVANDTSCEGHSRRSVS